MKLIGTRIILRTLKNSDAHSIYENAKDKIVGKYTSLPRPYRLKHAVELIKNLHRSPQKTKKEKTSYDLGIELKETNKIIGMVALFKIDKTSKNAELGFWLGKKHWNKGITSEAVKLILDFGFKKLKFKKIYAKVMHPNIASIKVLEKFHFKKEGTFRKHIFKNGKWLDDLMFGLLKSEYTK
ncbi:GNAT family N-acetyltransferase [Candidatus Woesearchaeota archaeon]|nr:GNAT family N-acetyltransferase [Candidatus Woesearchaeota archaeon]